MSSTKELYRRFLSLCQKWPVDQAKRGRDFGEFYRRHFTNQFNHGELSSLKDIHTTRAQIEALENIVANKYYNVSSLRTSTSTGLEPSICDQAMSNEGLELAKEYNEQSIIQKMKDLLNVPYLDTTERSSPSG